MTEMAYTVHTDDPEIQAIEVCVAVLAALRPETRSRVLRYLESRAVSMDLSQGAVAGPAS